LKKIVPEKQDVMNLTSSSRNQFIFECLNLPYSSRNKTIFADSIRQAYSK
jgi:hypothetical protein